MHEMGIALQIVEVAKAPIPARLAGVRIDAVNLKVDRLSAVVVDSLRFCHEITIKETPLKAHPVVEGRYPEI